MMGARYFFLILALCGSLLPTFPEREAAAECEVHVVAEQEGRKQKPQPAKSRVEAGDWEHGSRFKGLSLSVSFFAPDCKISRWDSSSDDAPHIETCHSRASRRSRPTKAFGPTKMWPTL